MQVQDTGLKAAIRNASTFVQETASKSEATALEAVERAEATLADAQTKWDDAREFGSQVVETLGHAGRTSFNGIAEFNGALGRYGKDALTDTIEFSRQTLKAKSLKDLVDLNVAFMTRRSQAMFASVNELNAIAQAKTVAAWSPFGETLRRIGEKTSAQASV
ncbi:MAG: phasin family protein [Hyphomonadaceae bacterium]|jgi:hypothetical protein|nr:phasin family protein [Hyphomonadaceae bacterium]